MAVSRITLNHANIQSHFQAAPLRGTGIATGRGGVGRGEADALARRMALQARINAAERFNQRTTALVQSVVPIVRIGRGGDVEVGVGTTVEQGKWLEVGTDPHPITPQWLSSARAPLSGNPFGRTRRSRKGKYLLRSGGPRGKGPNPTPLDDPQLFVNHPGNPAHHWLSDAVRSVVPGAFVRVRTR